MTWRWLLILAAVAALYGWAIAGGFGAEVLGGAFGLLITLRLFEDAAERERQRKIAEFERFRAEALRSRLTPPAP